MGDGRSGFVACGLILVLPPFRPVILRASLGVKQTISTAQYLANMMP